MKTTDAERVCVSPAGLQEAIDTLVVTFAMGRSFVRYAKCLFYHKKAFFIHSHLTCLVSVIFNVANLFKLLDRFVKTFFLSCFFIQHT